MTEVIITDDDGKTLRAGIDVGGIVIPDSFMNPMIKKRIFDELHNFKYRDDDIMLCTYPKCGTNWMYEILSMITNKSSERVASYKLVSMIECRSQEVINALESPRIINSHLRPSLFPKDLSQRKVKTVLCLRNPKDVAASFYHHIVGLTHYGYTGTFEAWLPLYLEGYLEDGKYTDYLLEWETAIASGLDFPLHIMFYEDLKLDPNTQLNKLLQFLEVDLDATLKTDIIEACSFKNMAKEKEVFSKELTQRLFKEGFHFFRKGEIGDWKNLFTVAQNKMFDDRWNKEMENAKMFKFLSAIDMKY